MITELNDLSHRAVGWLRPARRQFWLGVVILLLLTLLQFGDLLFTSGHPILSGLHTDLVAAEGPYRAFITDSLRSGVFPLWNPHIFSGTPFFTAGEAPLLYPPTWLHCVLPVDKAINTIIAFHIFWIGLGMYLWGLRKGFSPPAALIGAVMVMFGGPCFYHIFAGHISNVAAMAWVPFLFLAADTVLDGAYFRGFLIGSIAMAMEILAGQPQYTFYALFALAVYTIIRLVKSAQWPAKIGILAGAALLGVGVSAFQLLAVLPEVGESIRSGAGVSREFSAMFSLPPESVATLLAPGLFGDSIKLAYWGRYYIWETSIFMGVFGVCLAVCTLIAGQGRSRWIHGAMALGLFVLALGSHAPVYGLLFDYFPGFDKFRGASKFAFDAMLFGALLAAEGFDTLRRLASERGNAAQGRIVGTTWTVAGIAFLLAVCAGVAGVYVHSTRGGGLWGDIVRWIIGSKESYWVNVPSDAAAMNATALFASKQLFICCLTLMIAGVLFFESKRRTARVLLMLAVVSEMFLFAHHTRATIDLSLLTKPEIAGFLSDHPGGDYRLFDSRERNEGMVTGANDIWGYDSFKLRRYAEFMAYSQGLSLDDFGNLTDPPITRYSPLWRLVRLGYTATHSSSQQLQIFPYTGGLPHLLLVDNYAVVEGRDNILPTLADPRFDPRSEVILEQTPSPEPTNAGDPGTVTLVNENPNRLRIDVDALHPCILLISDTYSRNWKAVALPGSAQSSYQLLPADYILRAVPLGAGVHHISVEYDPPGLWTGAAVTVASLAIYLLFLGFYLRRRPITAIPAAAAPVPVTAPVTNGVGNGREHNGTGSRRARRQATGRAR